MMVYAGKRMPFPLPTVAFVPSTRMRGNEDPGRHTTTTESPCLTCRHSLPFVGNNGQPEEGIVFLVCTKLPRHPDFDGQPPIYGRPINPLWDEPCRCPGPDPMAVEEKVRAGHYSRRDAVQLYNQLDAGRASCGQTHTLPHDDPASYPKRWIIATACVPDETRRAVEESVCDAGNAAWTRHREQVAQHEAAIEALVTQWSAVANHTQSILHIAEGYREPKAAAKEVGP